MQKKCNKCKSVKIVKNWKRLGKQRFLCRGCWFVWEHWKKKNTKKLNIEELFEWYVRDDLKYRQMWQDLNISKRTIQRLFEKVDLKKIIIMRQHHKK